MKNNRQRKGEKENQEKGMWCWYVSALIIGLLNDVLPTVAVIYRRMRRNDDFMK